MHLLVCYLNQLQNVQYEDKDSGVEYMWNGIAEKLLMCLAELFEISDTELGIIREFSVRTSYV